MEKNNFHLNDLFWTLQGEGQWTGRSALFVRLPHCNYDCPWCDTEYDSFARWPRDKFLDFARKEKSRFAVITGGEPLAHKHLQEIVNTLKQEGFFIACETNGSFPAPQEIDHITCSPKAYTGAKLPPYYIHPDLAPRVSEWKYVVDSSFDFDILSRHRSDDTAQLFLSPEFNEMDQQVSRIMRFIEDNPQWRLSLQTHKWINID